MNFCVLSCIRNLDLGSFENFILHEFIILIQKSRP